MAERKTDDTDEAAAELLSLEPLPTDRAAVLDQLRRITDAKPRSKLTHCPECGVDLDTVDAAKHAQYHYPVYVRAGEMSDAALAREEALYRHAGVPLPRRVG